jgi:hypothetical protein
MKIFVTYDECYRYIISREKFLFCEEIDIPEEKLKWIDKIFEEFNFANNYISNILLEEAKKKGKG